MVAGALITQITGKEGVITHDFFTCVPIKAFEAVTVAELEGGVDKTRSLIVAIIKTVSRVAVDAVVAYVANAFAVELAQAVAITVSGTRYLATMVALIRVHTDALPRCNITYTPLRAVRRTGALRAVVTSEARVAVAHS